MKKDEAKTRLLNGTKLEENWDSYGGLPADKECAKKACKFIDDFLTEPYFVCHGPNGECSIEYRTDVDKFQVEIIFNPESMKELDTVLFCRKKESHKLSMNGSFEYEEENEINVENIKKFLGI